MTPEEFADKMRAISSNDEPDDDHHAADMLMCGLLRELGYEEGVGVFLDMTRWYA